MFLTKFDLALDEAGADWQPVFPVRTKVTPLTPEAGKRYRVNFDNRWRTGGFFNRALYTVDTVTATTVTLVGYGAVFPRNEIQFFPADILF